MVILAADVGATNSRLGLFEVSDQRLIPASIRKFHNRDYKSFGAILDEFLREEQTISSACFGIAGPVIDSKVHLTNLNWIIDAHECRSRLGTERVALLNDMEATGFGI